MSTYGSIPTRVEARQWHTGNDYVRGRDFTPEQIVAWVNDNGGEARYEPHLSWRASSPAHSHPARIAVRTIKGWAYAAPGDYVVMPNPHIKTSLRAFEVLDAELFKERYRLVGGEPETADRIGWADKNVGLPDDWETAEPASDGSSATNCLCEPDYECDYCGSQLSTRIAEYEASEGVASDEPARCPHGKPWPHYRDSRATGVELHRPENWCPGPECTDCGGSGYATTLDGEWLGVCTKCGGSGTPEATE